MPSINRKVDFKIIWKKINSELTPREEKEFADWLNSDPYHKTFYQKVLYYQETGEVKDRRDVDIMKAWKIVVSHLHDHKKRVIPTWVKMAGSVAATVLIMLSIYFTIEIRQRNTEFADSSEMVIPPGSSKARLIFDNGESIDLVAGNNFHGEVDGAKITNKGSQISYTASDEELTELKYNTLVIPRGAEYFVILSDSTKVWLNSDSRLRYPVNFASNKRYVELEGEAYFEVSEDEARPFIVSSQGQVVEVLGTEFNITAYPYEELIYTTLVEGRVKVFAEENPGLSQNLIPNYQTYMFKESGDISIREVDVNDYTAWKHGIFNFNKKTLSEMMNTLSRWYDFEVAFEESEMETIRFTGEVKRYENLEKVLRLIEKTQEVRFEKSGNQIIIR